MPKEIKKEKQEGCKSTPRLPQEECPDFEAPMWAHARMKKLGLDPYSGADWLEFKTFCE